MNTPTNPLTKYCSQCGSLMLVKATRCEHCGFGKPKPPPQPKSQIPLEQQLEAELDDDNITAEPIQAEHRFQVLRLIAGVFVFMGLLPWTCLVGVLVSPNHLGLSVQLFPLLLAGMVAGALLTTVSGAALSELLQLLVSAEHTLRVIAARLKPPTRPE